MSVKVCACGHWVADHSLVDLHCNVCRVCARPHGPFVDVEFP